MGNFCGRRADPEEAARLRDEEKERVRAARAARFAGAPASWSPAAQQARRRQARRDGVEAGRGHGDGGESRDHGCWWWFLLVASVLVTKEGILRGFTRDESALV